MYSENNLWVCGISSDVSEQILGTISKKMHLDNVLHIQWIIPVWNQDVGIMFALDSSCSTLLAVLLLTI